MSLFSDMTPEPEILSYILVDKSGQPINTRDLAEVLCSTPDSCTFRVQAPDDRFSCINLPNDLVVRLEVAEGRIDTISGLQRMARSVLGDVVPDVLGTGRAVDSQLRDIEYSITPYVANTVPLNDIWRTISPENQSAIMDSIADSVGKLQTMKHDVDGVHSPDRSESIETSHEAKGLCVGGPSTGTFEGIRDLLLETRGVNALYECDITDTTDGVSVQSMYNDIGGVDFTHAELEELRRSAVLCHNDLEPRNILVRETRRDENDQPWYEVAAIIDWECAGLYPFAWEHGIKNTMLGSSNLHYTWYKLFMERTTRLLPNEESSAKLMRALRIITDSIQRKRANKNVGVCFRAKWLQRQGLMLRSAEWENWIQHEDFVGKPLLTAEDCDKLELEVLTELGRI